jgi:hypothetical protein
MQPQQSPPQRSAATDYESTEYSAPFLATASIFGRIFRIAVYGSVLITVSALSIWEASNLAIEHVSMGRALPLMHDEYAWEEDEQEAWSGNHTGGGTDSRLDFWTRLAIRSAYSSQSAPAGPLQVGQSGARLIQNAREAMVVPDQGYLTAERHLVYAITTAREQKIELPDRAIIELEMRLASVRERAAGQAYLIGARKGYERCARRWRARLVFIMAAQSLQSPHQLQPRTQLLGGTRGSSCSSQNGRGLVTAGQRDHV